MSEKIFTFMELKALQSAWQEEEGLVDTDFDIHVVDEFLEFVENDWNKKHPEPRGT